MAPDPGIRHQWGIMVINSSITLKLKTNNYRLFIMTSLFFPDLLQTDKDLYFPSLMACLYEVWYLGTYFVGNLSYYIENGKKTCKLSNDDIISLKTMTKITIQFYFIGTVDYRSET